MLVVMLQAPVPTALVSLYQNNGIGYRISRALNWEVANEAAVSWTVLPVGSPA